MRFSHYTDRAVSLAAELVQAFRNAEATRAPHELARILRASGLEETVTAADVDEARELAAQLRDVFEASDAGDASQILNTLMATAAVRPHITDHDGHGPHLHFAAPEVPLIDRVRANTVVALSVILCDYGKDRLGRCRASGCDNVFVDTSRNAQRRYCSDGCANRSNVAAHRARQRDADGTKP